MNEDTPLNKQLEVMLKKARRSLAAAERHMKEGDYDFASSRAYYATFYVIEAMLLTKNLVFSKHSAVISAFNKHFIRTAIFPKEFSKSITRLFRERQVGDYEFDLSIEQDEAREDLRIAANIVKDIVDYLVKERFFDAENDT